MTNQDTIIGIPVPAPKRERTAAQEREQIAQWVASLPHGMVSVPWLAEAIRRRQYDKDTSHHNHKHHVTDCQLMER